MSTSRTHQRQDRLSKSRRVDISSHCWFSIDGVSYRIRSRFLEYCGARCRKCALTLFVLPSPGYVRNDLGVYAADR